MSEKIERKDEAEVMDGRRCGVDERLLLTLVLHARDHGDKGLPAKSLFLAQHNSCGLVAG